MSDEIYINETRALHILRAQGDFTETQARIVLAHSRKQLTMGQTFYPATYIMKRARDHAMQEN